MPGKMALRTVPTSNRSPSLTQLNGLTGDGTTNDDVDAAGETIFIYSNGTAYNAGITLENSQQLRGDQGTFLVNGLTIGASANNSTINHAGTGIVLASGNTVHGFDLVGTATGAASASPTMAPRSGPSWSPAPISPARAR